MLQRIFLGLFLLLAAAGTLFHVAVSTAVIGLVALIAAIAVFAGI